jgi:pimeloyl-ACP methyl ester carboxylesterase
VATTQEHRSIELPAGTIHYREAGPADGPVIVLVHGFLVDDTLWGDVPERLAARGFHTFAPTWPLGAHRSPMRDGADLSPRGIARVVLSFAEALRLDDVILVGNDTGGAICQFLLDEDSSRIGRLVLTNCDAFSTFPPYPFELLFRMARRPRLLKAVLSSMRSGRLRTGFLGFGPLVRRPLTHEETWPWVSAYLTDEGVRRDLATFARSRRRADLADVATRLPAYRRPVLLCWAAEDRMFRISLARRLLRTFPDARLVQIDRARTFVPLDQPARLTDEIARFTLAATR